MDTTAHTILIAALTATVTYLIQHLYTWKSGKAFDKQVTFSLAAAIGFALYILDWQLPWMFQDSVVQAFTKALALPSVIAMLTELAKKANPEETRVAAIAAGDATSPPNEDTPPTFTVTAVPD